MTEIEKARELFVSCRLKEAKPLLEELAGAGDSDALYMLAMMTYDVDIAIELLAKSAAKGNAGAKLMRLALMADASEETIAEAEKSIIPEIEKGAEEDPVLADALGTFYLVYGKKREGWTEKGMALLSMAEQKEYWKASIHLGSAFNELRENPLGDADQFNPGEAIIHFSFAAVKGAPEAEYFMGFLVFVLVGIAISGWQSSPEFSHKINFIVVVFGIPILMGIMLLGWHFVKGKVIENTGGRIESVWTADGPRYGDVVIADPQDDDLPSH